MTTVKSGVPCRHEQHPGCACVAGRLRLTESGADLPAAAFVAPKSNKRILVSLSHGICQVLDCRVRRGTDEPCQCKECLLDTLVHLCRSLHERVDAQIIDC